MAKVRDIISLAMDSVQDSSFESRMLGLAGRAVGFVAGMVRLPALTVVDSPLVVAAGAKTASMPDDYNRDLLLAYQDGRRLNLFPESFITFRRLRPNYLTATGSQVTDLAVQGKTLYLYPAPTPGATLHLTYQGNPPAIEPGTEIDDIIPAPFGSDLVEYYLCRECFSRIEDGIEGRKVNTDYYNGQFLQSFAALEAHIGTRDSEPQTIMDECGL